MDHPRPLAKRRPIFLLIFSLSPFASSPERPFPRPHLSQLTEQSHRSSHGPMVEFQPPRQPTSPTSPRSPAARRPRVLRPQPFLASGATTCLEPWKQKGTRTTRQNASASQRLFSSGFQW
ncbi:hypothetical protein IWZ03DRAFT_103344 [Phyllosticta citriasiana]|uniref:Uncharacterized protein n=1 Tax=Phyllosticta citriasiana TaxID=595635 RepID=A0ABR1KXA6_9PEZI